MSRLFMLILSIAIGTLAGIGVIIALVMGYDTYMGIIVSAAAGAILAFPASWIVARQIEASDPGDF